MVAIDHHETVTKLYTFGANSWKVIQNLPCRPNRFQAKFVSGTGTLNWIARTSDGGRWMILSFDLVSETYGEVFLPGGDADHVSIPELVSSATVFFVFLSLTLRKIIGLCGR